MRKKSSMPPKTRYINYAERELLNCAAVVRAAASSPVVAYWNHAYMIESYRFNHKPDGNIYMHKYCSGHQEQLHDYSLPHPEHGRAVRSEHDLCCCRNGGLEYGVLGRIMGHDHAYTDFEKMVSFQIPDTGERERLWRLNPGYSGTPIRYL